MINITGKITGVISSKTGVTGSLNSGTIKVYPELENLTVTPSNEQQTFEHPNSYGYDRVIVEAVENLAEDLAEELTEQDNLITEQKSSLLEAVLKLTGKTGGSGTVYVEEHCLEGTELHILLSNGQTLIIDLRIYIDDDHPDTIAEIEQLIISRLENKTIEEVE